MLLQCQTADYYSSRLHIVMMLQYQTAECYAGTVSVCIVLWCYSFSLHIVVGVTVSVCILLWCYSIRQQIVMLFQYQTTYCCAALIAPITFHCSTYHMALVTAAHSISCTCADCGRHGVHGEGKLHPSQPGGSQYPGGHSEQGQGRWLWDDTHEGWPRLQFPQR